MDRPDPFDIIAGSRPSDVDAPVEYGDDPAADALLRSVLSTPSTATRVRGRRSRRIVAALATIGVVGTGAVVAAVWLDRPSDPATLSCYSNASIQPDTQVGLLIDPTSTPIDQCGQTWIDGPLGTDGAPPLVACVTADGITAVVPGEPDVCAALGLAGLDPDADVGDDNAARVVDQLSATWPESCVTTIDEATILAERVLADLGTDDWTITVLSEPTPDAPCVVTSPDADQKTVLLVVVPPEAGP